jgi:ribosomal protein L37AE/L43A
MNRNCPKCGSSNTRAGSGVGFEHLMACNDGCPGWFEPKDTGCEACEKPIKRKFELDVGFCLDCQLEQAENDMLVVMNRVEELKQKIRKEQE